MSKPNKQHDARAASLKRVAKCLRVRALNYRRAAKIALKNDQKITCDFWNWRAAAVNDVAEELDAEAKLLRSMR
jgi:hypothetical protein